MAVLNVGEYEKIEELGGGGQGEVWKLRRKSDGKLFAGKFVKRGQIADDKVVREAEMLRTLDYPGLVKGHGILLPSSPREPILMLMELMDGPLDIAKLDGTLKSIVLMFVAKSLAFLHSRGIVHLDLKPANILMKGNRAKIGDFGSAKLFGLSMTQTSIALTQGYASPEALDGQPPAPSMDVYSFAMVAYEIAMGIPAFDPAQPPARLMLAILGGEVPQVPRSVAPVLREVIERGWARDPQERLTMSQVCGLLAGTSWCVFPGTDARKVAEAEFELPIDTTASPARIALHFNKLEAENARLRSEVAQIPAFMSEIARLKAENTRLTSEVVQIPAFISEIERLKVEVAQIPALKSENARISALTSENAALKAQFARVRTAPAPARPMVDGQVPVQQPGMTIQAGTLLSENAAGVKALGLELKGVERLLAKGRGRWKIGEFKSKVVGKAPVLVLVEWAGGICGGFAAVPFESGCSYTADPTGTSFVFSLQPTEARYALKNKATALIVALAGFRFGVGCLGVYYDGDMARCEETYAVPSCWGTGGCVMFTRFEVWRVAL
jgi:uncharacterized small protein (DUF1192 family)